MIRLRSPNVPAPLKFLLVDHNADGRTLLIRTLTRHFPGSEFKETHNADVALVCAQTWQPSLIVAHRTLEYDGATLIALLRRLDLNVPILAISGRDEFGPSSLAAGATAFLNYDAWLRIGAVVSDLLRAQLGSTPPWQVGDALGEAVTS